MYVHILKYVMEYKTARIEYEIGYINLLLDIINKIKYTGTLNNRTKLCVHIFINRYFIQKFHVVIYIARFA